VTISLPDVNVWLALVAEGHVHHLTGRDWFATQSDASVAFCRISQMALLRLLTNPHAMGGSPRTIARAWEIFTDLRRDRRVVFATDQERVDEIWRQCMTQPSVGPSSWTDAYLAALAQTHSYSLVTFDTGFKRWTDLKLMLLSAPAGSVGPL
jgi:toxin-antitoxin system PIN domain toxin